MVSREDVGRALTVKGQGRVCVWMSIVIVEGLQLGKSKNAALVTAKFFTSRLVGLFPAGEGGVGDLWIVRQSEFAVVGYWTKETEM